MSRTIQIAAGIVVLAVIVMLMSPPSQRAPENTVVTQRVSGSAPRDEAPARVSAEDKTACATAAEKYAAQQRFVSADSTVRHTSHFHPGHGKCFVKIDRLYKGVLAKAESDGELSTVVAVADDMVMGTAVTERDAEGKVLRVTCITYDGPPGDMPLGMRMCESEAEWNAFVDKYMK